MQNLATKFMEVRVNQRALGRVLIWLGVLAWVPYLYMLSLDQVVSIFPFLGVHLTGVLGGSWLVSDADKKDGIVRTKRGKKRRIASKVLIYLGVLAWAPYLYITRSLGQEIEITPYLIAHLTGILSGAAVRISVDLDKFFKRD